MLVLRSASKGDNMIFITKQVTRRIFVFFAAISIAVVTALPVNAAPLTTRSVVLSTSAINASATHTIAFTSAQTANIGSIKFEYCTTASGTCTKPTGLTTTSATLDAQSGATGFTIVNTTDGAPYITRSASNLPASTPLSYTLGTITNPSTTNTTFFIRITTYTSTNATTGSTDTGVVATSTANQITVNATVDETLTFCTGTSGVTGSSCAGATGTAVALGTLTTSTTGSGTSQIGISTNAPNGYSITVNGNTLTSGANNIDALPTQTTSTQTSEQFGINLRDNATPNVGIDPSGSGTATPAANYNTVDQYRFVSGDTIASKSSPDAHRLFTVSYIANVAGNTAAGSYTTNLIYVATANF